MVRSFFFKGKRGAAAFVSAPFLARFEFGLQSGLGLGLGSGVGVGWGLRPYLDPTTWESILADTSVRVLTRHVNYEVCTGMQTHSILEPRIPPVLHTAVRDVPGREKV